MKSKTLDSLDTEAARILKIIADSIEKTRDFSVEQAPDVVKQLVAYKYAETVFGIIVDAVLILFFFALGGLCAYSAQWVSGEPDGIGRVFAMVFSSIVGVFGFAGGCLGLCDNIQSLLKIRLAPKVFILEYLRDILGN